MNSLRSRARNEPAETGSVGVAEGRIRPHSASAISLLWRLRMPSATSSQTIGPFWHLIEHPEWADLTRFGAAGREVTLTGTIVDGDGNPVTDAAIELWQADPPSDEHFPAFGRSRTDEAGRFL